MVKHAARLKLAKRHGRLGRAHGLEARATPPKSGKSSALASNPAPPRAAGGRAPAAMDPRIARVVEAVLRNLDKPQSVKYYAAQLRLSLSRFEHLFKEETGLAFTAFVRVSRLSKAKDLLQDPTLRIKEITPAVGYRNGPNFTRDFKKQYGQTPSQSRSPSLRHPSITSSPRRGL